MKLALAMGLIAGLLTMGAQAQEAAPSKGNWTPKLKLSSNISANSSKEVPGQTDGDTITLGAKLDSAYNLKTIDREWRNTLLIDQSTSKTASLPRYVKTSDSFKLATTYLRSFKNYPKWAPYLSASAETQVFKGEDVNAGAKTYTLPAGSYVGNSLKLTDSFSPLTTKESFGLLYKAIDKENKNLEFRVGIGAIQVGANDQLFVSESTDTTATISKLESYTQMGLETAVSFTGKLASGAEYSISGEFLTPVGKTIEAGKVCEKCSATELTNLEFVAKYTTTISSWADVSYEYKATKRPELLNKFQIQNGLVLNIVYDHFN